MPAATPYISWIGHGAASLAPPGVFTGVTSHAFVFRASQQAMQDMVDRFLNGPAQGQAHYTVIGPLALATFMDYEKCTSGVDQIGWVPGRECGLWVPLWERTGLLSLRLVMWSPYIYIDYTIGMLTGREVWGWSKVLGSIALPGDTPGATAFSCATTTFTPMAPETKGVLGPLFAVTAKASMPVRAAAVAEPGQAFELFLGHLMREGDPAPEGLPFALKAHAVALKQVRDSLDPEVAIYQAVCDSPLKITRFGGFGLLDAGSFQLEITTCDSHRIAQDFLGQAPTGPQTVLPIEAAMWAEVDFQALPGKVIAP